MDVTERMLSYREAARGLWNNFLRQQLRRAVDFEALGRFHGICDAIFEELVLGPLDVAEMERPKKGEPYTFLTVQPKAPDVPIRVRRPSADGNRYWDDPVTRLRAKGLVLRFVDFYDFDEFGFIDLQFLLVRVAACEEHPHLVGRDALVEVRHGQVEFEPPSQSAADSA
jgi:hypothetical protein